MPDEFRIDTPYLPGEKGCRLTWIIAEDDEKTLYVRHEDLNELKELLNHGSTGKIEMEDGASSILVNSDTTDFFLAGQKALKIETLAFSNKTKTVSAFIPDKVSSFLNHYFRKEILFFEKKHKFKINIIPDSGLIIPEYKIHLLNRNKKIIKKIENFKTIAAKNNNIIDIDKSKKNKKKISEDLGKILWTKRKARSN